LKRFGHRRCKREGHDEGRDFQSQVQTSHAGCRHATPHSPRAADGRSWPDRRRDGSVRPCCLRCDVRYPVAQPQPDVSVTKSRALIVESEPDAVADVTHPDAFADFADAFADITHPDAVADFDVAETKPISNIADAIFVVHAKSQADPEPYAKQPVA
jgi:hypothetical protein